MAKIFDPKEALHCCISPLKIFFDSLKIVFTNKLLFLPIVCFTTLPLSFLIFTITFSTNTLRSRIYHLESLALLVHTRMEARHVWHESRDDAVSLLRIKTLFFLPCLPLSLAAAVSTFHVTLSAVTGNPATVSSAVSAVTHNWKCPSVTVIVAYVILLAYAPVPRVLAAQIASPEIRFLVSVIGSGFEVYLIAVLSMGFVVSIAEEKFGLEAIRVGSGLMKGRRLCGWVISGVFVLVSGLINRRVEILLKMKEGQYSTAEIDDWDKTVVICLYGVVVMVSYVIISVFYCDCRRRHVIRDSENDDNQIDPL
ncbi:hypothetical protein RIF29_09689 [Crotalaria pallida]|uniref:Transmembrane protein n=1 Tax=Crotalaria pallida TaxID=3830 RepID=A0AAN9IKL9_CROPI